MVCISMDRDYYWFKAEVHILVWMYLQTQLLFHHVIKEQERHTLKTKSWLNPELVNECVKGSSPAIYWTPVCLTFCCHQPVDFPPCASPPPPGLFNSLTLTLHPNASVEEWPSSSRQSSIVSFWRINIYFQGGPLRSFTESRHSIWVILIGLTFFYCHSQLFSTFCSTSDPLSLTYQETDADTFPVINWLIWDHQLFVLLSALVVDQLQ